MKKIAGIIAKDSPYAKYEFVSLTLEDNGLLYFESEFHFTKIPIKNEEDLKKEIASNVMNIIVIDSSITLQLPYSQEIHIIKQSPDDSYLALGFVKDKEQIQRERELWRVQMQDQLKRKIRGIAGPCEQLYSSDLIDALVIVLQSIKNF